jgi:hypothetical protein
MADACCFAARANEKTIARHAAVELFAFVNLHPASNSETLRRIRKPLVNQTPVQARAKAKAKK